MSPLDRVRLVAGPLTRSGSELAARCPAHDDRHASLTIRENRDGDVLVNCHRGCDTASVLSAWGLTAADLFAKPAEIAPKPRRTEPTEAPVSATYVYADEAGEILYEVQRLEPKGFRCRRTLPDGRFVFSMQDVRRVLYRLPELRAAAAAPVLVVEGEKDVDRLWQEGFVATTNVFGAGSGKWRPEYSEELRGSQVVLIPDNDESGRSHMREVGESLAGVAASVSVVELPGLPEKGDVSNFFGSGGTTESLRKLMDSAPSFGEWALTANPRHEEQAMEGRAVRLCEMEDEGPPLWIWEGYVHAGMVTTFFGDGGVGKSTLGLGLATSIASDVPFLGRAVKAGPVLWLDAEQSPRIVRWMGGRVAKGLGLDGPPQQLYYLHLGASITDPTMERVVRREIEALDPVLVVIDSATAAAYTEDPTNAAAMAAFIRLLTSFGTAVILIDHVAKGTTAGRNARQFGSTFKHNLNRGSISFGREGDLLTLAQAKLSYGPVLEQQAVRVIHAEDMVQFIPCVMDKRKAAAEHRQGAKERVLELLAEGPMGKAELIDAVKANGAWSDKTVANTLSRLKGHEVTQMKDGRLALAIYAEEVN